MASKVSAGVGIASELLNPNVADSVKSTVVTKNYEECKKYGQCSNDPLEEIELRNYKSRNDYEGAVNFFHDRKWNILSIPQIAERQRQRGFK